MKQTLLLSALVSNTCFAQDTVQSKPRISVNEIAVSYGYFTRPQLETGMRRRHHSVYSPGMDDKERGMAPYLFDQKMAFSYYNWRRTGALSVSYRYQISRKLSGGITVCYEENKCDIGYGYPGLGYRKTTAFTIAGTFQLIYYKRRSTELYGAISGGMNRSTNEYVSLLKGVSIREPGAYTVLVQLSPIGIRLGRKLGGFAELGAGFKGVVQVGGSLKL